MTKKVLNLKWLTLATVLFVAFSFASCEKDDEDENSDGGGSVSSITASNVVNSVSEISVVKAEIYWEDNNYVGQEDVIAETLYKNSSFTLDLPASVPAKYLEPFWDEEDEEEMDGITVSDKTVNALFEVELGAYDKDDEKIGEFHYQSASDDEEEYEYCGAMWVYVDKDVTVKGQSKDVDEYYNEEYITNYNLTLKKGWNIFYFTETYSYNESTEKEKYTSTISNQKPSGVTLKWYFEDYSDYGYKSATLKSAKSSPEKKIFFSKIKRNRK